MNQNFYKVWVLMLVVSGGIALWFASGAIRGLWKFTYLDAKTSATVSKIEILDLSSSRFAIEADYTYQVQGVTYSGKTLFDTPRFLNHYAAENYVKAVETRPWETWYHKKTPSFSSLERDFPEKQCLQALITVGVFAYFYIARSMLSRMGS
jgi:hypothetical protein